MGFVAYLSSGNALASSPSKKIVHGADMSALPTFDCDGTCSPFKNSTHAQPADALLILKSNGVSTVRLRVWNDPTTENSYCNKQGVMRMAKRVHDNGLDVHLDFHYSDFWADPGKQNKPHAWANLNFTALVRALGAYTKDVVEALVLQGTVPAIVQVGNEIDYGLLWAPAGRPCDSGGYVSTTVCSDNWPNVRALVGAGIDAVRAASPTSKIMIHTAHLNGWGANALVQWHKLLIQGGELKYDQIGMSCYERANCGSVRELGSKLEVIANAFPTHELVIVETAYPFEEGASWKGDYPFTPEGQTDFLVAINQVVSASTGGAGVYWWGSEYWNTPDWYPALWDRSGVALPALHSGVASGWSHAIPDGKVINSGVIV